MIILDENLPDSQRQSLQGWRIKARQIGVDVGVKGVQDEEIIPLLHRLRRPTFFTLDFDFYQPDLRHARYCLVCLNVEQYEAAMFIRRFLQQPTFDTEAKRMGKIIRVGHTGLWMWQLHAKEEVYFEWDTGSK